MANLDRYCLNAMLSSVKDISKGLRTRRVDTVRDALREVIHGRRRRNLETELNSAWVYRHQSLDRGRTHVRHVSLLSHIDRGHTFNVIVTRESHSLSATLAKLVLRSASGKNGSIAPTHLANH